MYYSADSYFIDSGTKEYNFDPAKLPLAHSSCLRLTLNELQHGKYDIVVDNTNTSVAEIAPYAALALAYDYEVKILSFHATSEQGFTRNKHNVPLAAIEGQQARLATLKGSLPPWWPIEDAPAYMYDPS